MSKLTIEDHRGRKTQVPLSRDELTFGRAEGNTIRLNERNVSRHHLKIRRVGRALVAVDSSRFGTLLNGKRFTGMMPLQNDDVLTLGEFRITVEVEIVLEEGARRVPEAWIEVGRPRINRIDPAGAVVRTWILDGPVFIGKGRSADIFVDEVGVMKRHMMIAPDEGRRWQLSVLDAATTVSIDGKPAQRRYLRGNEVIEIGCDRLQYKAPWQSGLALDAEILGRTLPNARRRKLLALGGALLVVAALILVALSSLHPAEATAGTFALNALLPADGPAPVSSTN